MKKIIVILCALAVFLTSCKKQTAGIQPGNEHQTEQGVTPDEQSNDAGASTRTGEDEDRRIRLKFMDDDNDAIPGAHVRFYDGTDTLQGITDSLGEVEFE